LGAEFIEFIHDDLVSVLWPGTEPVGPDEQRSTELIESAVGRPFQSAFGADAYPALLEKAVALFHSLIANHPFLNGNKRTAVIAFDIFLMANGYFLFLSDSAMYTIAQRTASYKQLGLTHDQILKEIRDVTGRNIVTLEEISQVAEPAVKEILLSGWRVMRSLRRDPRNRILR
jgi:death on curing protein